MDNHKVTLKYTQSKTGLASLPTLIAGVLQASNVLPQSIILELVQRNGRKSYVNWDGLVSSKPGSVELDVTFAQELGISDNDSLVLNVKLKNPVTFQVRLDPVSTADWELTQLHANIIEDRFINQTRCVATNQVVVVYPTKTSAVKFIVSDVGVPGADYALIAPHAELEIAPKEKKEKEKEKKVKDTPEQQGVLRRGISLPHAQFDVKDDGHYIVYGDAGNGDYVSVSINGGPHDKHHGLDKETHRENRRINARVVPFVTEDENTVGLSHSLAVALGCEGIIGSIVTIRPATKSLSKRPAAFIIQPYITQTKSKHQLTLNSAEKKLQQTKLTQVVAEYLHGLSGTCVTNFTKIPRIANILPNGALLRFRKNDDLSAWIKPYEGKKPVKIELGEELLRAGLFIEELPPKPSLTVAIGLDGRVDDIVSSFLYSKNTGTLVYGNAGSGKSLVLGLVEAKMNDKGFYTEHIKCETLMNENYTLAKGHMAKWLQACAWHKPSLLILDNLDKILAAEMDNVDSSKSNQLSEYLVLQLEKIRNQRNSNVSVLLSSTSKELLNKLLSQCHLIEDFVHLRAPDKKARLELLEGYITGQLGCKVGFDLMDMVTETEGYLPNDLKVLSDRLYHEALFEGTTSNAEKSSSETVSKENGTNVEENGHDGTSSALTITRTHLDKSLEGYTPSNLRGVKLQKSGVSWNDIGGLKEAKNVLLETLEWPTKYAPIFASCPLRLRSGILLYGYPGCGKTLLASAVAGQCGLNFISIKGPEILNKYIGASEQSVRELFERAQAAKPCILFFDEFDSIAPKRGHDSTGVTDRVVNQMLTQMDGAEGLDGVYVLAATSRPDLIDSALLRPGRLDKSVICDMPDYDDRLDILQSITAKMDLGPDVNLNEIAEQTGGFSGADMQGLGYNAYLKAVHVKLAEQEEKMSSTDNQKHDKIVEFIKVSNDKQKMRPADRVKIVQEIQQILSESDEPTTGDKKPKENSTVWISHKDFVESLKETKPSISLSEKRKLQAVYSLFVSDRDGNMPDGSASTEIGGRTTLM